MSFFFIEINETLNLWNLVHSTELSEQHKNIKYKIKQYYFYKNSW
jgi:hypothetical protein